ncbi:MAG: hypothetical protein LUQ31_04550 [Methanoregula sp.]|nr:hypothetical protein [Methanoregula sp.]
MNTSEIFLPDEQLKRYACAVRETRDHAAELESFGKYQAWIPYKEKYVTKALLDRADLPPAVKDASIQEYERVTRELEILEYAQGRAYRDILFRDLSAYVSAYEAALCSAETKMCDLRSDADLFMRDKIGVLVRELGRNFPLTDIRQKIAYLDETYERLSGQADEENREHMTGKSTDSSDRNWEVCRRPIRQKEGVGPQ